MQKEGLNNLYRVIKDFIEPKTLARKNKLKAWTYGYNNDYDFIVISKDGTVGEVILINGLFKDKAIKKGLSNFLYTSWNSGSYLLLVSASWF